MGSLPLPFHDVATQPEEDRATDMHMKFDKDQTCSLGDMLAKGETNTQTLKQTNKQADTLIKIIRSSNGA